MKLIRFLGIVALLLFSQPMDQALAQGHHGARPHPRNPGEERAKRWRGMERPHKQDMRKRLKQLDDLGADKRKAKLDRAKRLREIMNEVYGRMDAPTKAKVDALNPRDRAKLLGKLALEEARNRSREARLILGSKGESGAGGAGNPGSMNSESERAKRKAVHEQFLEKARKRLGEHVQKNGLPQGMTQKDWDEFQQLKGRHFGRRLRRLGHENPELLKVMGPPPGLRKGDRERRKLSQALRLPPHEHMKLLKKGGEAAVEQAFVSRRGRVMDFLRGQKKLTVEELATIEAYSDKEFMQWVEKRMRSMGEGPRGPGGRPHRPGGPGGREGWGDRAKRGKSGEPRGRRPGLGPHPGGGPPPGRAGRGPKRGRGEGGPPHPPGSKNPK